MKKLLLSIILMLSVLTFAQYKTPTSKSKSFIWKDGYEKNVFVKFKYYLEEQLNPQVLDGIIFSSMKGAQYKLNNRLSFVPVELIIMRNNMYIKTEVRFRGKNAYGTEYETTIFYDFNNLGENLTIEAILEYYKQVEKERLKSPEQRQIEKDSITKIIEKNKIDSLINIRRTKHILNPIIKIDTLSYINMKKIPNAYSFKYKSINRIEYYKQKIKYSVVSNEIYYTISFSKYNMFQDYPNDKESLKPTSFFDIEWCFNDDMKEIYIDDEKYVLSYNRESIDYYKNLHILLKLISNSENVYIFYNNTKIILSSFHSDVKILLEEYDKTIKQKINWRLIKKF